MLLVINAVLPVILLAVIGYLLFQIRFISSEVSSGLNRLVYWVGLPCLLFHKIAEQDLDWTSASKVLIGFFLALGVTIACAYLWAKLFKINWVSTGAFVQASYRGNLGFIGLPVVLYAANSETLERTASIAALALTPCAIAFNVIAVIVMILHQPSTTERRPNFLLSFISNPLILGGLLGVLFATLKWRLPLCLDRTIEELSNMSVPVALIGLGSSFGVLSAQTVSRNFMLTASASTFLKVAVSPALGVLVSLLLGLDAVEARVTTIFLAAPTAIASHVIVSQFNGDEKLAASAVVSATLMSIFFLPIALWITQEGTWNFLLNGFQ